MKKVVPVFAMALAVLAAFAFTTNGNSEEVSKIGFYDSNSDGTCDMQFHCGPAGGDFCTVSASGQIRFVHEKTDCTIELRRVLQ